jgi:hypothetical protein
LPALFCDVTAHQSGESSTVHPQFTSNSFAVHCRPLSFGRRFKQISAAGRGLCGGSAKGGYRPNWQGIIPAANQGDRHARM